MNVQLDNALHARRSADNVSTKEKGKEDNMSRQYLCGILRQNVIWSNDESHGIASRSELVTWRNLVLSGMGSCTYLFH